MKRIWEITLFVVSIKKIIKFLFWRYPSLWFGQGLEAFVNFWIISNTKSILNKQSNNLIAYTPSWVATTVKKHYNLASHSLE